MMNGTGLKHYQRLLCRLSSVRQCERTCPHTIGACGAGPSAKNAYKWNIPTHHSLCVCDYKTFSGQGAYLYDDIRINGDACSLISSLGVIRDTVHQAASICSKLQGNTRAQRIKHSTWWSYIHYMSATCTSTTHSMSQNNILNNVVPLTKSLKLVCNINTLRPNCAFQY